jgi:drug/metabolite transporter (DMT)-like permease
MRNAKELLKKGSIVLAGNTIVATALTGRASAAVSGIQEGANSAQGDDQEADLVENIKTVTNTMLFVIGVVAVIMLIVGGFRYIFSGGNSQNTTAAKDTILYAVVGIVVALLAYAIVNFVLGQFSG